MSLTRDAAVELLKDHIRKTGDHQPKVAYMSTGTREEAGTFRYKPPPTPLDMIFGAKVVVDDTLKPGEIIFK